MTNSRAHHYFFSAIETGEQIDVKTKEGHELYLCAEQALRKQIPKKVYHFKYDDTFETTCCGADITNKDYQYCPYCGQNLGEVEEVEE